MWCSCAHIRRFCHGAAFVSGMSGFYKELRQYNRALEQEYVRGQHAAAQAAQSQPQASALDALCVSGTACHVMRSDVHHAAQQQQSTLLSHCGALIDRHDARALLDFVRPPTSSQPATQQSEKERREEEALAYERCAVLVC